MGLFESLQRRIFAPQESEFETVQRIMRKRYPGKTPEKIYLLAYADGLMITGDGDLIHRSELTDNPVPPPRASLSGGEK